MQQPVLFRKMFLGSWIVNWHWNQSKTAPKNILAPPKKSNHMVAVFKQSSCPTSLGVSGENLFAFSNLTLHFPWDKTVTALFAYPTACHWEMSSWDLRALEDYGPDSVTDDDLKSPEAAGIWPEQGLWHSATSHSPSCHSPTCKEGSSLAGK